MPAAKKSMQALPPVNDMVQRLSRISREKAQLELRAYRSCTLDFEYFDKVERELNTIYLHQDEEEREKDRYYMEKLGPADRQRADRIISEFLSDLAHTYKEVQSRIDLSGTGTYDRIFWMYIRRELNKARKSKGAEKEGA